MATYTIATIGTKEDQKYFESAKQILAGLNLGKDDTVRFVDITGKTEQEIKSIGPINGIMYFNDIHNEKVDDPSHNDYSDNSVNVDTFAYALNLANNNSDNLSIFTLSHDKVTDADLAKENTILQKYVDKALKTQAYPVNVSNLEDFKHYLTGIVELSITPYLSLANSVETEVEQIIDKLTEVVVGKTIEDKSSDTDRHIKAVAEYTKAFGQYMVDNGYPDFSQDEIDSLYLSALLHDVGKIGIPDAVLGKTAALNYNERQEMDYHSAMGGSILETIVANNPELAEKITPDVIKGVAYHHKDYDGLHNKNRFIPHTPDEYDPIRGEDIGKFASIIAVADCIDAMTAQRAYNNPKHIVDTFRDLWQNKGTQFKPEYAEIGILVLAKEIAKLGIDPNSLFTENMPRDFKHKDSGIIAFLKAHENEFEVAKDVPEGTYSSLGFRLDNEGYFEFENPIARPREHSIRYNDELAFLKNQIAQGKMPELSDEALDKKINDKFAEQDLEGKEAMDRAMDRARVKSREEKSSEEKPMSLGDQILDDVKENGDVTIDSLKDAIGVITTARQQEISQNKEMTEINNGQDR